MVTEISSYEYNLSQKAGLIKIDESSKNKLKKAFNDFTKESPMFKPKKCMICGVDFGTQGSSSSICISHSIPRHSLKSISENGKLYSLNKFIGFKIKEEEQGTKNAGTFRLICRKCDSLAFREYENFSNYTYNFNANRNTNHVQKILNEIAMKNYLSSIYSKENSILLCKHALRHKPMHNIYYAENFLESLLSRDQTDLRDSRNSFQTTKRLSQKNLIDSYRIIYYNKLKRKAPVALQGVLTPVRSFDGTIVNNVFRNDAKMQNAHICMFPSADYTIVLVFARKTDGRVLNGLKILRNLSEDAATKAVLSMALDYIEDIFFSHEAAPESITQNPYLRELAGDTQTTEFEISSDSPIPANIENILEARSREQFLASPPLISRYAEIPNELIGICNA